MVRGWRYARPSLAIIVPLLFMSSVYAINLILILISHDIAMHSNLVPCASLLPAYPFLYFFVFLSFFVWFLFGFCCYDLELCTCFSDIFRLSTAFITVYVMVEARSMNGNKTHTHSGIE